MNLDLLRPLLYPLGLVANLLFGFRFLFQWLKSEKKRTSTVTPLFWALSLTANTIMCLHALIQLQYPVCLIQALSAIIAWRNLNLMSSHPISRQKTITIMGLTALILSLYFYKQGVWMRPPTLPWIKRHATSPSFLWHLVGISGMVLFASRFWIQWWLAEKHFKSYLGKSFWWISLSGALLSIFYFIRLNDIVNIIGYSVGFIPYLRNIMLLNKMSQEPGEGLYLFAGEPSGDLLGGQLVEALRHRAPSLQISGVGGPLMHTAGMKITHPMERFQVMGISDVLKALPRLIGDFRKIKKQILKSQPAGVVLIDYPEFNMLLAKALRKKGYQGKLIHYVCPSVWAWRKKRVRSLAKTLDSLLSILPFEQWFFSKTPLSVTYVGHPLVSAIANYNYDTDYLFPTEKPLLALFPGSRKHEIALNLPLQWEVAKQFPEYTPVVSVARPELLEEIQKHVDPNTLFVPQEKRYELMRAAQLALATSGTIVLEMGLHALPTVVTYRLATLNYLLGRYLFRIHLPFYSLVNIICAREVFPEFVHRHISSEEVAAALRGLNREECQMRCFELKQHLLDQNASQQAADTIVNLIT